MKFRLQCMSKTRQSNYTVACRGRGILCKNGNVRCKNHGGKSTGATSLEGKIKSIKNLKQFKNVKGINSNSGNERQNNPGFDARKTVDPNCQG